MCAKKDASDRARVVYLRDLSAVFPRRSAAFGRAVIYPILKAWGGNFESNAKYFETMWGGYWKWCIDYLGGFSVKRIRHVGRERKRDLFTHAEHNLLNCVQ